MRNTLDKYLPFFFWAVLVAAATWASWSIVTSREAIEVETSPKENAPGEAIPPAVVDQPILEETSADGSVRWTLYLDRIVKEEGPMMELAKPRALYRFGSGEILEVTSETGTYNEMERVLTLTGNVTGFARVAEYHFAVDQMIWDSGEGLLTASGGVRVTKGGVEFRGSELRLDLTSGFARMEVTGSVSVSTSQQGLAEIINQR